LVCSWILVLNHGIISSSSIRNSPSTQHFILVRWLLANCSRHIVSQEDSSSLVFLLEVSPVSDDLWIFVDLFDYWITTEFAFICWIPFNFILSTFRFISFISSSFMSFDVFSLLLLYTKRTCLFDALFGYAEGLS